MPWLMSVLLLVPVGAIAFIVWAYQKKVAQKNAASDERYRQLFGADPRTSTSPVEAPASGRTAAATPVLPLVPQGAATYSSKERLLSPPETLLYYVLKAGLPDHVIFAHVNLAAVVEVPQTVRGYEREQQQRQLARYRVDFVVCDRNTNVVAVAEFESTDESAAFKTACLKTAGIRHVPVNPAAIPKRDAIRPLIFGAGSRQP
jgi:hypothetical protein